MESQHKYAVKFVSASLILLLCYLGWLACGFTVHYYDSFQYLNNAKALAGLVGHYDYTRPPVFPALLVPLMLLYRATGNPFFLESVPHLYGFALNAAAIFLIWRALKEGLGREFAAAAALLLTLSRVVFHYMPFVMLDIIAAAMAAEVARWCVKLVCEERRSNAVWAGCWLAIAASTKHYLAPLCAAPALFLLLEWVVREDGRVKFKPQLKQAIWLCIMAFSCLTLFLIFHRVSFWIIPETRDLSLIEAFRNILERVNPIVGTGAVQSFQAKLFGVARLLAESLSAPLLIASAVGCALALKNGDRAARIFALIAIVHLLVMTMVFTHQEARYFLPIYPAVFYFIGYAAKTAFESQLQTRAKIACAAAGIVILIFIVRGTAMEAASFADPIYGDDIIIRIARFAREQIRPQSKIYWISEWISLRADSPSQEESPEFSKEYYYLFQANTNALTYYSDRAGFTLYPYLPASQGKVGEPQPGDLIVYNPNQSGMRSASIFPEPIRVYAFERFHSYERDGSESSALVDGDGARLTLAQTNGGLELRGKASNFFLWRAKLKDGKEVFTYAMPVQTPGFIKWEALKADEIQSLLTIPIGEPQNLFF